MYDPRGVEQVIRRAPRCAPDRADGRILRCAFSGYRPHKLPFGFDEEDLRCLDFKRRIRCEIEDLVRSGYSHFLSGCAQGFDTFAAEAVMDVRRRHPWVTLEMVVPYEAQAERWEPFARLRHEWNLNQADTVTWISRAYTHDCLRARNRYLVDHCDLLLTTWDGCPGGTQQTAAYAARRGKEIRLITPAACAARPRFPGQEEAAGGGEKEQRTTA